MPHAALVHVKLDASSDAEHRLTILRDLVAPEVRALPGFRNAAWMSDGETAGVCLVVLDTRAHAESALATLTRAGGPPVLNSAIYDVELEI